MTKLTFGFSKSKSFWKIGSQIIREIEKRDYSHAYIRYYSDEKQCEMVAQASHGYVHEISYENFKIDNIVVKEYCLEVTPSQFKLVMSFIGEKLGSIYSKMQILLIAVKKILLFEIKQYNKDKYFICSEFAAMVCIILEIKVPQNLDYCTPSDLDTLLSNSGVPAI